MFHYSLIPHFQETDKYKIIDWLRLIEKTSPGTKVSLIISDDSGQDICTTESVAQLVLQFISETEHFENPTISNQ